MNRAAAAYLSASFSSMTLRARKWQVPVAPARQPPQRCANPLAAARKLNAQLQLLISHFSYTKSLIELGP